MTVASQIKQSLATLKGIEASIEKYALHHPDADTKAEFKQSLAQVQTIITDLEKRIQQIEFEEPQFKGF